MQTPSHVLYVDDILIFYKGVKRELLYVKQLIMEYDQAFGQQINQTKCKFYTCKVSTRKIGSIASFLGFSIGCMSFSYLCNPLKSLRELLTNSRLSENLWLGREHQHSSQNFTWEPRLGEMARLGERECVDTRRDPKVGGSGVDSNKPSNTNTRQDPKVGGSGVDSNKPSNANTRQGKGAYVVLNSLRGVDLPYVVLNSLRGVDLPYVVLNSLRGVDLPYSWKPRLSERFSPERERIT
ncbi:hypothetical protein Lal_00014350 [Lupinus albus]|nr:hypothetical protein Lal_00014350 [Lupinus albus]